MTLARAVAGLLLDVTSERVKADPGVLKKRSVSFTAARFAAFTLDLTEADLSGVRAELDALERDPHTLPGLT